MTNLTLSTILAVAALAVAAAGIVATVPDAGPLTVSVDGTDGVQFESTGQSTLASAGRAF